MGLLDRLRLLCQLAPVAVKTAVLSVLRLSQNTAKQDLKTEVIVAVIKKLTSIPRPLLWVQRFSLKDPGIKGPLWIAKVTMPAPPEADALEALLRTIKDLGDGSEQFTTPTTVPVEAEWTGARRGVSKNAPRPDLPEDEQYKHLVNENASDTTILYFHGGAYMMMDPSSHRVGMTNLSKRTGGRILSVRYRLAPQHPFPAALLDALISYLYLIAPPPGSWHDPIKPSSIIFSGESAGGGLSTALLLLLLHLRRSNITHVQFHGQSVELGIPAGIATYSSWLDVSHALPSIQTNARYDYLTLTGPNSSPLPEPPSDEIWPASPPRAEIYCNASMLSHPLVSPCAAPIGLWEGTPPIYMVCGEEVIADGITATARQIYQAGGTVHLVGHEGMPHCFGMMLQSDDCWDPWAKFCVDATTDPKLVRKLEAATWTKARTKPVQTYEVELSAVNTLSDDEVQQRMKDAKMRAVAREEALVRDWEQKRPRARL